MILKSNLDAAAFYSNLSVVQSNHEASNDRFRDIFVVVHSSPKNIPRMVGVAETWAKFINTAYVLPKVCEHQDPLTMKEASNFLVKYAYLKMDVRLLPGIPKCYEYPPINVWLHSLLMCKNEVFQWLLKCDDDVYLNVDRLRKFLKKIENTECQNVPCYFGALGVGRPFEKHLLGLNGKPFVMGGPCVVMSRSAFNKILPILPTCMTEPVERAHSDTLLGRCFQKVNITAGLSKLGKTELNDLFKQYYPLGGAPTGKESIPFSATTVPRLLDQKDHERISLHTLKTREEMHNVHAQLQYGVKPLFSKQKKNFRSCTYNALVANSGIGIRGRYPLGVDLHNIRWNKSERRPLCVKYTIPLGRFTVQMVYIISLNAPNPHVLYLQRTLNSIFSSVTIWPAVDGKKKMYNGSSLSGGENGLKETFASLFLHALSKGFQNILVFEDDALLLQGFSHWWQKALRSNCLMEFCAQKSIPSVVLLGTTIYGRHIWQAVEKQITKEQLTGKSGRVNCFDTPPWAYGAFAVLYNARLLPVTLNWLEQYDEPFDWIWNFLAVQGYPVKSLAPFLAIAELGKPSSIRDRSQTSRRTRLRRHRWNTSAYMKYIHSLTIPKYALQM